MGLAEREICTVYSHLSRKRAFLVHEEEAAYMRWSLTEKSTKYAEQ